MLAERFGSYSIEATLPGTPSLSRRKSMTRYRLLWPLAAVPDRNPSAIVASIDSIFSLCQRFIRTFCRNFIKRKNRLKSSPGEVGLNALIAILTFLQRIQSSFRLLLFSRMLFSSRISFRRNGQNGAVFHEQLWSLLLSTFTPNIFSTASLICILFARVYQLQNRQYFYLLSSCCSFP